MQFEIKLKYEKIYRADKIRFINLIIQPYQFDRDVTVLTFHLKMHIYILPQK